MSELTNTEVTEEVTEVEVTTDSNVWTPPTQEEFNDLLARKNRADSEAASRKRFLKELGYDPKTFVKLSDAAVTDSDNQGGGDVQEDAAKPVQVDTAAIERAAADKAEAVFIALASNGVGASSLARVSKLIDRDGDIASQIATLKEELPELFKRSRTTNVADATAVGGGKKTAPTAGAETLDYKQILANQILGK